MITSLVFAGISLTLIVFFLLNAAHQYQYEQINSIIYAIAMVVMFQFFVFLITMGVVKAVEEELQSNINNISQTCNP